MYSNKIEFAGSSYSATENDQIIVCSPFFIALIFFSSVLSIFVESKNGCDWKIANSPYWWILIRKVFKLLTQNCVSVIVLKIGTW